MSKKVDRLAGKIATDMLRSGGIAKSAGSTASVMPTAVAVAELIVAVRKRLKVNGRLLEENGRKVAALAASYGAATGTHVPGPADVEQGLVNLDLERFGVGLVDRKKAPKAAKAANGHYRGDGLESAPAPLWHPENDH